MITQPKGALRAARPGTDRLADARAWQDLEDTMDKPLLNQGWKVKIPSGLRGVVRHIYYDGGWWAVVGRSCYRHEELEVIRANPVDVLRSSSANDPAGEGGSANDPI